LAGIDFELLQIDFDWPGRSLDGERDGRLLGLGLQVWPGFVADQGNNLIRRHVRNGACKHLDELVTIAPRRLGVGVDAADVPLMG
jgi:hypothetical protein